jgi:HlyD family type I secretion membrane fusion protein
MTNLVEKAQWYSEIPRDTRAPTLFGIAAVAASLIGFGWWGNTAPIAGAIVTSGVFVSNGQNKIIQHLEGGVIKTIRISEGDLVEPGQVMIELDDTAPRAELRRLVLRHARLSAMGARLQTEMAEGQEITFPAELLQEASSDPEVSSLIDGQSQTFDARRNNTTSDIATLQDGISALQEHISGSNTQLEAVRAQLGLFEEELQAKAQLLQGALVRRPEVLALRRARANMQGEVGRLIGDVGDAKERIARINEQIRGVHNAAIKAAVEQLHEVNGESNDVRERIRSAQDILNRINVTAPVRGVVVKLRYHTPGGVIEAGKSILEIVPLRESLIIEARIRPQDIEHVKVGQGAVVRLSALSQRVTPMVSGEVVYLSADALPDEKKGPYGGSDGYIARVRLNEDAAHIQGFEPTSGMPAEVYIRTGDRTFFQYLMRPVMDSFSRAFRES